MVYCRFGEGLEGIGSVIVERGNPGFTIGKNEPNMSGAIQNQLFFEDAIVPVENVLIRADGFRKMMLAFNAERCGNATMSLLTAQCGPCVEHGLGPRREGTHIDGLVDRWRSQVYF